MSKEKNDIIKGKLNKEQRKVINYLKNKKVVVESTKDPEEFLINLKGVNMQGKTEFERTVLSFIKEQLEFNKNQLEFNKNQLEFNKKQLEFNKTHNHN